MNDDIRKLLELHNLTEDEYEKIKKFLGREPNYTELGIFSVMWSEHCSYKSSRVHLKKLPTSAPHVIQGPGENAGVVDIGKGYAAVFKIESHNHPSYIEPFEGAATGVGGIIRDVFTMGARPVALLDSLRFGELDNPKNRLIFKGVVEGISSYGNSVGVPTVGGETFFDNSYSQNPLVNVFCMGIAKKDKIFYARAKDVGAKIFYVGAKTGRDGIHGATMASAEFDETLEEKRPNVQVGDPFKEKLLIEATLEAMEKGLISAIQDMGAAGLTSSSVEMAGRGGTGVEIDVSLVPTREEGMTPYEIMLSESQERMLVVAEKGKEEELKKVYKKWDLDAVEIGKITGSGKLIVKEGDKIFAEIPINALTEEAPTYERDYIEIGRKREKEIDKSFIKKLNINKVIEELLDDPNISDKSWIYEQYDHMVQINTVSLPGNGSSCIRLKGEDMALCFTVDGKPDLVWLNPYEGTKMVVAEAFLNLIVKGAEPLGASNCLNFGNPEKPEIMGEFKEATSGMGDASRELGIPITGGNVSFYNETMGKPIKPTPVYALVGKIEGLKSIIEPVLKKNLMLYLAGNTKPKLDGSFFYKKFNGKVEGILDEVDFELLLKLKDFIFKNRSIIEFSDDVSEGGIFTTLLSDIKDEETGFIVNVPDDFNEYEFLFGENYGMVIFGVEKEKKDEFENLLKKHFLNYIPIGETIPENIKIVKSEKLLFEKPLKELLSIYKNGIKKYFKIL